MRGTPFALKPLRLLAMLRLAAKRWWESGACGDAGAGLGTGVYVAVTVGVVAGFGVDADVGAIVGARGGASTGAGVAVDVCACGLRRPRLLAGTAFCSAVGDNR